MATLEASRPKHGRPYYLVRNLGRKIWGRPVGRVMAVTAPLLLLAFWFLGRGLLNPWLVALRRQSPALCAAFASLGLVAAARGLRSHRPWLGGALMAGVGLAWMGVALAPGHVFRDLSLYGAWRSMERHPLERLPLTRHERIYPLSMVTRIVEDRLTQSHYTVSPFEMQMDGEQLTWVAQETPAGLVNTLALTDVRGLVQVAASSVTVDVQHHDVDFAYGRDLLLIKDLGHFVLPNQLGLLDLFDKQLDSEDLSFRLDDQGRWVMVMAVVDWDGIFPFCVPRFGGVFVCPQRGHGPIRWVEPEEIESVPFLRDQNWVPELVTTFYAESWKFHEGLWGWLRNRGVTKITSIPEDTAQQPFAVYFEDVPGGDGIYQFFALEPDGKSAGISKMLLFDPRGYQRTPPVHYYDFEAHGIELVGPARIAETIKASDIHADWRQDGSGTFVIAESRPFIQERQGRREFRWFNSVVTQRQGSGQPRVVLADPGSLEVRWLDPGQVQDLLRD